MAVPEIKVLDKALLILSIFRDKDNLSLQELEEITKLNISTIYRILRMYVKWGFIEHDSSTNRYQLSIKVLEIANSVLRRINSRDVSQPYLLRLREETGESAILTILENKYIIVVDWEPSYYDVHIKVTIGKRIPE